MKTFEFVMVGQAEVYCLATVQADTLEQAQELALRQSAKCPDWFVADDPDVIGINFDGDAPVQMEP